MASTSAGQRRCKLHFDVFCYICGCFTVPKQRQNITDFVNKTYLAYFGIKVVDQDKSWAPHKVCRACVENRRQWTKGKWKSWLWLKESFGIPMVWSKPANHVDNCYFCIVNVAGFSSKNKSKISYPNIPSAMRSVTHSDSIPVPIFTPLTQSLSETDSCASQDNSTKRENCCSSSDQEKLPVLL